MAKNKAKTLTSPSRPLPSEPLKEIVPITEFKCEQDGKLVLVVQYENNSDKYTDILSFLQYVAGGLEKKINENKSEKPKSDL